MNYNEFLDIIKSNKLIPAYIFTGEEEYLMHEVIDILKHKFVDISFEAINYIVIDGKDARFDNILNACETLPFMSSKKIVVIKDISEIIENDENDVDKIMGSYIEGLDDYLCLIIMDRSNKLKKTSKLYKALNKLGGVVEFTKLKGKELNLRVEKKLKEYNKKISNGNLSYFLQQSTYTEYNSTKSLYDLENELLKVINFSTGNEISKEDIDLTLTKTLDTNIFNLLSSINKRDGDSALRIFNEMYISNEPVQRILFMIIRQLRLMLGYKLYKEKGYNDGAIQEKLQIKPYEFKKISSQAQSFSELHLRNGLDYILELDVKQKTSSHDEKLALEMLIINLCYSK
ncbi:DNA polymerase III subunit delta [Tissierella sp.]|uniref:DNA polymerase III subunit delta n=1 Tax=Tissierella sp. TaxID=41274 RepID=UPI00285892BB|nr:DNA polymerase III subunit delta [Tissierella sp.]MDR7857097.1 DNA polymerase III subunit delta [Tissierella sp.]